MSGSLFFTKVWPAMLLLRTRLLLLLLATLPVLTGFGPPKLVESDREMLPIYPSNFTDIARSTPPPFRGTAALVMDAASGQVAYERNGYARIAPASTTKLATALVVLDRAKLSDRVTIKREHLVEGSAMGILPGEELTVEDLLWGMMLPSGNDAATALAMTVAGSIEKFAEMMNEKAKALGLRETHFRNPHGLDEDEHFSTAYELALLARAAQANPTLAEMMATATHTVRAGRRVYYLVNTNKLLSQKDTAPGADGVKTGFTDNSGDSLIASATRDGRRVIVVVMGTNMERAPVAANYLNYAFSAFTWMPLGAPAFSQWKPLASDRVRSVTPAAQRYQMTPRWMLPYIRTAVDMSAAAAPDQSQVAGAPAGRVSFWAGPTRLIDLPLYLGQQQGAG